MILSTKGRYAVTALVDLAAQAEATPVSLQSIAERQDIPLKYLEQIFLRLRKAGLVSSVRGPGGGYRLARKAAKIHISEIILAAEEEIRINAPAPEEGRRATTTQALTHNLWEGLGQQIYLFLRNITLEDVAQGRVEQRCPITRQPEAALFIP